MIIKGRKTSMIQIRQNINLTDNKMKEIELWYIDVMSKILIKAGYRNKNVLADFRNLNIKPASIKTILIAKQDGICRIKNDIDLYAKTNTISNELYCKSKSRNKKFFVECYKIFRKEYGIELCKKLEITVCPYCNQNYINSFNGTETRTTAEFDHFINKSRYPIFAISLYNLIPCCHDCNHIKGIKDFKISPYDMNYTTDKLLTFSFIPTPLSGDNDIIIKHHNDHIENNILVLKLKDRYQLHTHYVSEIIEKTRKYPKSYFDSDILVKLGMTDEELYLGNYLSEENYYKRPLSKLARDINKEVKELMRGKDT